MLSKGKFVSPIFGTRSGAQLQSNIGSLDVELEQGVLAKLDELSGPVTGGRLPSFLRGLSLTDVGLAWPQRADHDGHSFNRSPCVWAGW
jgi:hypothetical protein